MSQFTRESCQILSYTVFFIWSVTGPLPAILARIACCNSSTVMSSGDLFRSTITVFSVSAVASVFSGKLFSADAAEVSEVFFRAEHLLLLLLQFLLLRLFFSVQEIQSVWKLFLLLLFFFLYFLISAVSVFTGIYSGISPAGTQISPLFAATVTLIRPP